MYQERVLQENVLEKLVNIKRIDKISFKENKIEKIKISFVYILTILW